jgi:hypothetical protein
MSIFRVRPYRVLEATYNATLAVLSSEYIRKPVKRPATVEAFTCHAAITGAADIDNPVLLETGVWPKSILGIEMLTSGGESMLGDFR